MRRCFIYIALLGAGCFQAVPPIGEDGGADAEVDGGFDGGVDGGSDGGLDGGFDGGQSCDELVAAYGKALTKAKKCNPVIEEQQCVHLRDSILGCQCPTFVADPGELDAIASQWKTQSCPPVACPLIPCPAPKSAECAPTPNASEGECRDRS